MLVVFGLPPPRRSIWVLTAVRIAWLVRLVQALRRLQVMSPRLVMPICLNTPLPTSIWRGPPLSPEQVDGVPFAQRKSVLLSPRDPQLTRLIWALRRTLLSVAGPVRPYPVAIAGSPNSYREESPALARAIAGLAELESSLRSAQSFPSVWTPS